EAESRAGRPIRYRLWTMIFQGFRGIPVGMAGGDVDAAAASGLNAGPSAPRLGGSQAEPPMDATPAPFVPPAPKPRQRPPSTLELMRIVYRNPLELWGEPSYNE